MPLLVACGDSTVSGVADGERVPATPLPDEQHVSAASGPTGFVTLLSIDGYVVVLPRFHEDETRTRARGASPCSVTRAASSRSREVSAGPLTVTVPTRTGDTDFEVLFDPKKGSYEPATFEALVEPGGVVRISAAGRTAPAFDAEVKMAANVAFETPGVVDVDASAPEDITVTWSAEGDNDEVFLDLMIGDGSVMCWFDSTAGTGTVPAALVAELVKDGAVCEGPTCMMFLASRRTRDIRVGDWTMVLSHGFATIKDVRVTR